MAAISAFPRRSGYSRCSPRGEGSGAASKLAPTQRAVDVTKPYESIGFGAMDATKPYESIGFGAMDVTKPYDSIGFGTMDVTKPYESIGFGAMDVTKPYESIGFGMATTACGLKRDRS